MRALALKVVVCFIAAIFTAISPAPVNAQARGDLDGLWDGVASSSNIVELMKAKGQDVPFTAAAAERYKKVDFASNPNGYCLPPGPSRAVTGPSPFQIVQDDAVTAILFENHGVYRIIYTDGRSHPPDIQDYPQFMGHSIGKWEGDTLVVDTVGTNARTWLDSNGLEHSEKLHLTERFRRTEPDKIQYSVTYDDPEFFTKPWTMTIDLKRLPKGDRLIEYVCNENEKDRIKLQPTTR